VLVHVGSGAQNWLALVGQVCDVGELVAVELEDVAEGGLLTPLAGEALSKVGDIHVEHLDLRLVVEGGA